MDIIFSFERVRFGNVCEKYFVSRISAFTFYLRTVFLGSEGAPTPIPGHYGRPPSSSTVTSNGSAPNTIVGGVICIFICCFDRGAKSFLDLGNSFLIFWSNVWFLKPVIAQFLA